MICHQAHYSPKKEDSRIIYRGIKEQQFEDGSFFIAENKNKLTILIVVTDNNGFVGIIEMIDSSCEILTDSHKKS